MATKLATETRDRDLDSAAEGIMDWFDADPPADDQVDWLRRKHEHRARLALVNEWSEGRDYDEWVRASAASIGVGIP
jgi:hypothetical protein